ncbi:ubiquitin fusion degradation protein 1 [Entomortierella parvispora]|uniref:Ubiquitin fusion degradation protein 1 n=1 Tax=Entomortierella parvispora TaxID=205924 RepID=A0A9P3H542_9FUNG|nr:ubiquitin fusion degradation protein 1 [Entomortierella parvispora]
MYSGYDDYPSYGGFGMGSRGGGFSEQYRCYSVAMMQGNERQNVNNGGKIILPQSALAKLASLHIQYPMLFELSKGAQKTHAGVLEFIAEEGRVYLPHWMMKTLVLNEGDLVTVKSAGLPLGSFVKIQPQSVDFLDISDPKAVLENALRNFSTLTQGDNIEISYNDKIYGILVMEIKPPGVGISIVETDLEVDFAPPVGYQEPTPQPRSRPIMESKLRKEVEERMATPDSAKKVPFEGQGQRLSNTVAGSKSKTVNKVASPTPSTASTATGKEKPVDILDQDGAAAPAALNLPLGHLFFGYKYVAPKSAEEEAAEAEKAKKEPVFEGSGQTLRPPRKTNTRGSGANSPSPSVISSAGGTSRASTPAQPAPAAAPTTSESKPELIPFQGKGNTMR